MNDKLKYSAFYKHYFQHVELVDPEKVNNEYVANKYKRSIDANGYGAAISYDVIPQITFMLSGERELRLPE